MGRDGYSEEDELIFDDLTADIGTYTKERRPGHEETNDEELKRLGFDPDKEYAEEIGYDLVRSLRGKNVGRRFKRTLFKFALQLLLTCLVLFILACQTDALFSETPYFDKPTYGASLQSLQYCVSFPGMVVGYATFQVVRNWASFVTNRDLLASLFKFYLACIGLLFIFMLWLLMVWCLTFRGTDWGNEELKLILEQIQPYYTASLVFLIPLNLATIYYIVVIQGLIDEVEKEGDITEPDVDPDDVTDLSDVSFAQAMVLICAMPCILSMQCFDCLKAVYKAIMLHYRDYFPAPRKTKRRNIWVRCGATFMRLLRECITGRKNIVIQSEDSVEPKEVDLELQNQHVDREEQERLEREIALQKAAEEEAKAEKERIQRQELEKLEAAAAADKEERKRQEAEKERIRQEAEAERKRLEVEAAERERIRLEEEQKEKEKDLDSSITLSIAQFKSLWSTLGTAGSFQAKLKVLPQSGVLTAHLKKQGFHIVFVATPTPTDLEIGLCNTRVVGNEKWFMARFLATQNSFSAVMKAEDKSQVTMFVKKFALAKVLKIDSSK